MKKKILLAVILATTAIGGGAIAADAMIGPRGPMRADTNGDGVVSRAEFFTAAETRFKDKDANGDRTLTGAEMQDRAGRFARQDTNNDGVLSFTEAAAATAAQFKQRDLNNDGKLEPEEMGPRGHHGMAHMMHDPDGQDARPGAGPRGEMGGLGRLDANGDGRISRDEMRAQSDRRFDRLDTNHDGFIDQAELEAGRQRGPGGRGPGGDMPPPPPPPLPPPGK